VILSSLSDGSPLNCGIGSSEIYAFKLRMIASWIGGAVFWCDIHLGEWCSQGGALQFRPFHIPWGKSWFQSLERASRETSCIASCGSFLLHSLVLEMEGRLNSFRVLLV